MSNYRVVLEGDISSGYQLEDVKKNLATLFKVGEKKIDALFTKPQVVLKKGLDYDSALKYSQAIQNTGAVCNVKAEAGPAGNPVIEKATPPDLAVQALKQTARPPVSKQSAKIRNQDTVHRATGQSDESSSATKSVKGIGEIIAGVAIIGIGFAFGGSVFLGNPDVVDYIFDGLGIFWIGRGIYKMVR